MGDASATMEKTAQRRSARAARKSAIRKSAISTGMLNAISRISELNINNTIQMHPAFACQNMNMFLDIYGETKQAFIPYLVGNPGTGKTYAAERLLDASLGRIKAIFDSHDGTKEDFRRALSRCVEKGLLGGSFEAEKSKELINYLGDSGALSKMMTGMLDVYEKAGAREKDTIRPHFSELLFSLKEMAVTKVPREDVSKGLEKRISPDVYVLPAAFSALDKISEEMYIISQSGIERKVKHPIVKMISEAYEGTISVLIIDEASETVKEKEAARVKNLHPLLDAQVNGKPLFIPISSESIDAETRKDLESLRKSAENRKVHCESRKDGEGAEKMGILIEDIGNALDGKMVTLEVPLPETFCIFMTGNVRKEHEQLGFTESTWRRVQPIRFSYLPPEHMELFLTDLERKYRDSLRAELGDSFQMVDKEIGEKRAQFIKNLNQIYRKFYDEYVQNPSNFSNRMLPSLRSMSSALRAFDSYYAMSRMIREDKGFNIKCTRLALESSTMIGSSQTSISKTGERLADLLPTQQEFGEFLLAAMELSTFIPVGSFTETSETRSSEAQMMLNEKGRSVFMARGILGGRSTQPDEMFSLSLGKDEYVYSKPNFMYLLYSLANSLSHQRMILMVGESQEGKSTIVDVSRRILESESDARYFTVDDSEEFTLKDPNIEKEAGGERKALRKSLLRQIVEESSGNQDITSIVKVDEIDNLRFSQELNSLFTRRAISIGGKEFNIGNLVIIGTSNMSRMMLDNFVSRSGIPLVFTKSLSRVEYSGQNFDARNIYLLHSAVERTLGIPKKADAVISAIISDPGISAKIAGVEFYEFAKSANRLEKYIRSVGSGAQTAEYVSAASSYIDSIGVRNAEMERMKKGDSIG